MSVRHRGFRDLVLLRAKACVQQAVVLRYGLELEARQLAPATINLRLAAVRRLAYEAADTGLLSVVRH